MHTLFERFQGPIFWVVLSTLSPPGVSMGASVLMCCHDLPASFLGTMISICISFYLCFCFRSRLRFSSSKIAPALSIAEAQDRILYSLQESSAVRAQTQRTTRITIWGFDPADIVCRKLLWIRCSSKDLADFWVLKFYAKSVSSECFQILSVLWVGKLAS